MSLEPDFLTMTTQTVTLESLSTVSLYGAPQFSTASSSYPAYIVPENRLVTTADGREEVSNATVIILSTKATMGLQDRITLPSGQQPRVLRVDTLNDDQGQHHLEIALG